MIVCYRMMFLVLGIITGILGIYFIKSDDISYLNDKSVENSSKKKDRRLSKVLDMVFLLSESSPLLVLFLLSF